MALVKRGDRGGRRWFGVLCTGMPRLSQRAFVRLRWDAKLLQHWLH